MRRWLVVAEFALSLVLMIAAGLLLGSFWDLLRVPLGFNPENVMAVRTRLPAPNDPKVDLYGTAEKEAPFLREVLRRTSQEQGDPGLDKTQPFGWETGRHVVHNSYIWLSGIEHSTEHFGQLVVYYRANNLVPPESRR